jgi:hypothetical protein
MPFSDKEIAMIMTPAPTMKAATVERSTAAKISAMFNTPDFKGYLAYASLITRLPIFIL